MQVEREVTRVAEADESIKNARQNEAQGYLVVEDIRVEQKSSKTDEVVFTFTTPHGDYSTVRSFELPKHGAYSSATELAEFLSRIDYDEAGGLVSLVGEKVDAYYDNVSEEWVIGRNPRKEAERSSEDTLFGTGDKMALAALIILPMISLTIFTGLFAIFVGFGAVIPIALWCDQFNEHT